MRQTEKYQFNLIDPEDKFLPDPLNENTEKTEAALNSCARIAFGTYVGTGTFGKETPCTLTFDFEPKLVMVYSGSMGMLTGDSTNSGGSNTIIAARPATSASRYGSYGGGISIVYDYFTWDGNTFSWYSSSGGSQEKSGSIQLNYEGSNYYYMAIG